MHRQLAASGGMSLEGGEGGSTIIVFATTISTWNIPTHTMYRVGNGDLRYCSIVTPGGLYKNPRNARMTESMQFYRAEVRH
jgi:hypothetical protein